MSADALLLCRSHHDEILRETNHLRCSNSDGLRIKQDGVSSHETMNIQLKAENAELWCKNKQLMHELERLKADGASERQCRLQSESASAPAAPASAHIDMAGLLKIFDAVGHVHLTDIYNNCLSTQSVP